MPKVLPRGPEGTIWFGGEPDEAILCLAVVGDSLDPAEITLALCSAPSRSQRKGEPVLSPAREVMRIARKGAWILNYPVGRVDTIGEAMIALLGSLSPDKAVWASLASRFTVRLTIDLTVKCVNRGFELSPEVLVLVAERSITLGFDIFCELDPHEVQRLHERFTEN